VTFAPSAAFFVRLHASQIGGFNLFCVGGRRSVYSTTSVKRQRSSLRVHVPCVLFSYSATACVLYALRTVPRLFVAGCSRSDLFFLAVCYGMMKAIRQAWLAAWTVLRGLLVRAVWTKDVLPRLDYCYHYAFAKDACLLSATRCCASHLCGAAPGAVGPVNGRVAGRQDGVGVGPHYPATLPFATVPSSPKLARASAARAWYATR
jgi:hypothetical protein